MDTMAWAERIRTYCRENADPVRAAQYTRYFTEGYDPYGLDQKLMEKQLALWLAELRRDSNTDVILAISEELLKSGKYEETSFAILFAIAVKKEYMIGLFERFGRWFEMGFVNWAHTDMFSGDVLSQFFVRGIVPLAAFEHWRTSASKWQRRAVPVSLIKPLKTDIAIDSMLALIEPMMIDSERCVQQGLGWFLREAWKKYPAPVEAFLHAWKDRCGRTIIQYATEKMNKGNKAQFARIKKSC